MVDKQKLGSRLKFTRKKTKLSLRKFCEKYNYSYLRLTKWESGVVMPPLGGLHEYLNDLRKEKVKVEIEWLLYGIGAEPYIEIKDNDFSLDKFKPHIELISKVNEFISRDTNNFALQISDDFMYPDYMIGDFVCGVKDTPENSVGKDCIISLSNGQYIVRNLVKVQNRLLLLPKNQKKNSEIMISPSINYVAPITIHLFVRGN